MYMEQCNLNSLLYYLLAELMYQILIDLEYNLPVFKPSYSIT